MITDSDINWAKKEQIKLNTLQICQVLPYKFIQNMSVIILQI